MTRVSVGPAEGFEDGDRELLVAEGVPLGVFRVDGSFYAVENDCCHLHGPVCEGKVQPRLEAEYTGPEEGVVERFGDEPVIACPWHGWEYSLATGVHVGVDDVALRTFEVTVEDGEVYVEVPEA